MAYRPKRVKRFNMVMSKHERTLLDALCVRHELDASAVIRKLILDAYYAVSNEKREIAA